MKKIYFLLLPFFIAICLFAMTTSCKQNRVQSDVPFYAQKINDTTLSALLKKGRAAQKSDYKGSMEIFREMLRLSKERGNNRALVEVYRKLVFVPATVGNELDTAMYYSNEAMQFAKQLDDVNTYCDIYGMRAMVFQILGENDSAIFYNKLAIKYMDEDDAPDSLKNWSIYINISNLYSDLNNEQLAIENTKRYLNEYALKTKETDNIVDAYNNLAVYYTRLKDSENAKKNLYEGLNIAENDTSSNVKLASIYYNLYIYYTDLSPQLDSADKYIKKHYLLNSIEPERQYLSLSGLANIAVLNKDIALAKELSQNPMIYMAIVDPNSHVKHKWTAAYHFYKLFEFLGDKNKTLEFLKAAHQLGQEYWEDSRNKGMEQYELQRKKVMQENRLLANELKLKNQNNTILSLIIGLIILGAVGAFIFFWFRRKNELLRVEKEFEKEKSLLKGQLEERNRISRELHDDLGASLTSIALSGELLKHKNPMFKEELSIISSSANDTVDTLNEIVWSLNSRNDSLLGLVAYIRKFATNYLNKVNIKLTIKDNLTDEDVIVSSAVRRAMYLTSKEAINNIAKHSAASAVTIDFNYKSDIQLLSITIKDNGKGLDQSSDKKGGGNGMHNMKKNMELIKGTFNIEVLDGVTIIMEATV